MLTTRLVALMFAPLDEVAAWLQRLGLGVDWDPERTQITITNPWLHVVTGIAATLPPLDRAPALCCALGGPSWPQVWPGVLEAVHEELLRRRQEAQRTQKG